MYHPNPSCPCLTCLDAGAHSKQVNRAFEASCNCILCHSQANPFRFNYGLCGVMAVNSVYNYFYLFFRKCGRQIRKAQAEASVKAQIGFI